VALAAELKLGAIAWGAMSLVGIVVGIAFLGLGTEVFIGERGQFGGGGVMLLWPAG
jgi:hypothetical protein